MDQQAGVATMPPEVKGRDTVSIESHYLCSWDSYLPHNHSEKDALFNKVDQTMD